jgi:hypothetical protein
MHANLEGKLAAHRKVCVISGTVIVANYFALFVSIAAIQVLNRSPTLSDKTLVANRVLMYVGEMKMRKLWRYTLSNCVSNRIRGSGNIGAKIEDKIVFWLGLRGTWNITVL